MFFGSSTCIHSSSVCEELVYQIDVMLPGLDDVVFLDLMQFLSSLA